MNVLLKILSRKYTTYRVKELIQDDIKSLRKINTLINRFEKTGKNSYIDEIKNVLLSYKNLIEYDKELIDGMIKYIIEEKNTKTFILLVNNLKLMVT